MAGELGVLVLGVGGVLDRVWGEGKRIGGEFVIGGADGEGFDDPESGCARLGGDFADEGDAHGMAPLP